jgi:hypothetical protein
MLVIIVVSDFVFTVLRLQAVLFPDLPINPELANLSDLSGALFVSMVFLTGALTLDFLGVLPPPARLFPTMDNKKRRMFLALSLGAFLLNMAVVGVAEVDACESDLRICVVADRILDNKIPIVRRDTVVHS